MRLLPAALPLLVLLALPALANDGIDAAVLRNAEQLRNQATAGTQAYALVESLTTEVGPRMAGTPADARAVAWAVAKLKSMGFDRVYTEDVPFTYWHRGSESAQVLSPFPQPLHATALGGSVSSNGDLDAEVVRFANLDALIAAPEGSLAGKIAFIDNRMQRAQDGSGYSPAVSARSKGASEAAKKGALAIVIRSIGTDDDRLPHTGMVRYAEGVAKIPAAALSNPDADLLAAMLRRSQPVRIRLNLDVGLQQNVITHNVIAEIRGRSLPDEVVVIGGHLDSWDKGTGAIDDATGVGITMAAAAMIGQLPRAPRRTIRVILWGNEEQGVIGGKAYAAAHAAQIGAHQIGAESDFGSGRIYALRAGVDEAAWPVIEKIGTVLAPLGIVTEKPTRDLSGADISPLAKLGMPWAQLAQDGSDYFDWHHTDNDTLDKVEARALDQQVAAYAVFAYLAAETTVDFGSAPEALRPKD